MNADPTDIPGCLRLQARVGGDRRGTFAKTFETSVWARLGMRSDWQEEIHTTSRRGVIRGMHFQTPPAAHAKLLFCVAGEIEDVVVDLRRGSPTFGQHRAFALRAEDGDGLYVPSGLAHGFASLADASTLFYKITSAYSAAHDAGISWDGFGYRWPVDDPVLSDRDRGHPRLADYDSPFVFDPVTAAQ